MNLDRQCSHATSDIGRWMECHGSLPVITRPNLVFLKYLIVCQELFFFFFGILLLFFFLVFNFFFTVTFFLHSITFYFFFYIMAEPLHSPLWMLHILEHTLGDKAATATWLHDSKACGHGTSKLLSCTLDLGFTSLCSLSSSSSLKFSFT